MTLVKSTSIGAFRNDPDLKQSCLELLTRSEAIEPGKLISSLAGGVTAGRLESRLGIPEPLAFIIDYLHVCLGPERALTWSISLFESITVGQDLADCVNHFMKWLLSDRVDGAARYAQGRQLMAIQQVAELFAEDIRSKRVWENAMQQAWICAAGSKAAFQSAPARAACVAAWRAATARYCDNPVAVCASMHWVAVSHSLSAASGLTWGDSFIQDSDSALAAAAASEKDLCVGRLASGQARTLLEIVSCP